MRKRKRKRTKSNDAPGFEHVGSILAHVIEARGDVFKRRLQAAARASPRTPPREGAREGRGA